MVFNLSYNLRNGQGVSIQLQAGDVMFVLGANGSGKSSLMQSFYQQSRPNNRRITAHRQTWFASNTLDLTPQGKRNTETNIANTDGASQARYTDTYAAQRASMTIFELIDAQNVRARSIAASVDAADIESALEKSAEEAPLAAINSLLILSNIPIRIEVIENEQIVARKNNGPPYSIAELSDGERNALLIAGDVLTAKPGSLLIIDEPERHLHRSIISPLLTLLFEKRRDCTFVVATHDVDLPLDNKGARVLLVRSATYQGQHVQSWEADLLEPGAPLDDGIKRDVIGSRRRILFVEGGETSLDKPLYSLIFPMVSVISKDTCKGVEQSVVGLRDVHAVTWVKAWGIVDGDNQSPDRVRDLESKGIFALPFYSVESIYYHPLMIRRAAEKLAAITSADADENFDAAIYIGIARVRQHLERMALNAATRAARDQVLGQLPTTTSMSQPEPLLITVNVRGLIEEKKATLNRYLDAGDWAAIVARCPIRESGALDPVSKAIGFPNHRDYEAAVRTLLRDDEAALRDARSLFPGVYTSILEAAI